MRRGHGVGVFAQRLAQGHFEHAFGRAGRLCGGLRVGEHDAFVCVELHDQRGDAVGDGLQLASAFRECAFGGQARGDVAGRVDDAGQAAGRGVLVHAPAERFEPDFAAVLVTAPVSCDRFAAFREQARQRLQDLRPVGRIDHRQRRHRRGLLARPAEDLRHGVGHEQALAICAQPHHQVAQIRGEQACEQRGALRRFREQTFLALHVHHLYWTPRVYRVSRRFHAKIRSTRP